MSEEEKWEAAAVCLDGDTLAWFQWEERRRPIKNWEELKIKLLHRCCSTQEGSLCAQFLALHQMTTSKEYRRQFEKLASSLQNISEEVLECNLLKVSVHVLRLRSNF